MRRGLSAILAVLVLLLVGPVAACGAVSGESTPSVASGGLGNGWQPERALSLDYATQFDVDFYQGGLALVMIHGGDTDSRYLVVPEGGAVPDGIDSDIVVLRQPLVNTYVAATSVVSLFSALDAFDDMKYTSLAPDAWYVPSVKAAMEQGHLVFGGKYSSPDYELLLQAKPSLAIENTMINHSPAVKEKLESVGIPVLVEQSSYENHPLGRTEWIKLIGVLVGKQGQAEKVFADQAAQLDALAGRADTGKTVAFFYISSAGYAVARKSGDYIPAMIQLAGGRYIFSDLGDDSATSTVNLEMEQFYAQAKDADYVIYNAAIDGAPTSLAEFTALSPLLADFKAVQDGQVWTTGKDFYQDMTGLGTMVTDIHEMLTWTDGRPNQFDFLTRLI
ncbi:MAG: ABC transporter substrate-binding protein [Propionibacteriaceae bacterium]|jgi:iron complex transport system substrate-binding protein|nr:ABC transporter substrate-binding protein [Propionibacteriaceae bacterium]